MEFNILQEMKKQFELKKIRYLAKKRNHEALITIVRESTTICPEARLEAINRLRELKEIESVPTFINLLNDYSIIIRRIAIKALGEIGDSSATYPLIKQLEIERDLNKNKDDHAIDDILRALGKMRDERAVKLLVKLLCERNLFSDHERGIAAASLGQIRFESAVPILIGIVKDTTESDIVSKNAIWALREITGKDYESALKTTASRHQNDRIPEDQSKPDILEPEIQSLTEKFVAIIDYGMGNLHSVQKAVEKLGFIAKISSDSREILQAQAIILPGVGAFKDAIEQIKRLGLDLTIKQIIDSNKPFLGICLGMQLLFSKSFENGVYEGLDIIKGDVKRFPDNVRIPHIGWNTITNQKGVDFPLLTDIPNSSYFYFVHSYYVIPRNDSVISATTLYGVKFPAIIRQGNVYATQFHPEKSQLLGLKILKNFLQMEVKEDVNYSSY